MRSFLACMTTLLAVHAQAAPAKDCAELAQSFRDDVSAMAAASLGRLRACTTGEAWSVAPANKASDAPAPQDMHAMVVLPALSAACKALADQVAHKGLKPLTTDQRTRYRSCIDNAITSISSRPRPGTTANMPTRKIPDGAV